MVLSYDYVTSVAGHSDGHAEVLTKFMRHRPMQHVQSYTGSHWTLPSGNSPLRIALAAARATINKTPMQNVPTLLAASMPIVVRQYDTKRIA